MGTKASPRRRIFCQQGVPISEKPETRANRRADALTLIAENHLDNVHTTCKTADRYQVIVHADAELLAASGKPPERAHAHVPCELENGPALAPDTVRRLCCDASVTAILSLQGEPLSIWRKSRTIPPPMPRALLSRDGGCRFPGCDATRFVDGHRIVHWVDGDETSQDNLVLLCKHHHRAVHEEDYDLSKVGNGELRFTRPDAIVIPTAPVAVSASESVSVANRRNIDPITENTGWFWRSARMDYGMAV